MGGGSWTSQSWSNYSTRNVSGKSTKQIYSSQNAKNEFLPLDVVRESRDSEEHPNSTPIILGLDVTGSMGDILSNVANKLGIVVGEILDREPVSDPQILFAAVGDYDTDQYGLQVTQFESDIRIAEQLRELYFEKGGGGNGKESYPLAWYFASRKTNTDQFEKRGKKGFIFTMGDDGLQSMLRKKEIKDVFGDTIEADIPISDIITEVNRKYEVYHFCMQRNNHWSGDAGHSAFEKYLGERAIVVKDYEKIPELIISILEMMSGKDLDKVVESWDGSTGIVIRDTLKNLSVQQNGQNELVEF